MMALQSGIRVVLAIFILALPFERAAAQDAQLKALNQKVVKAYRKGDFTTAIDYAKRALAIAERQPGPRHRTVGPLLNNLATLYKEQGQLAKAQSMFERTLAIFEKALGRDHLNVATVLNNLGVLYQSQGLYKKAERTYKRTLAIMQRQLGPNHRSVGTALNNLAELYRLQGRYAEAEPLFKRDLAISRKHLGNDHQTVGSALSNLAALYSDQGRNREALRLYRQSLKIKEKKLGREHPSVATTLNNLALLHRAEGRFNKAEQIYKRSLVIFEKRLGREHPKVGMVLNNLGTLYRTQQRYRQAERLLKRSIAVREKALGKQHPRVATSVNNLAELYHAQHRHDEAEPLYWRSLHIRKIKLGARHPQFAQSLNNLAALYDNQGKFDKSIPLHKQAIGISEATFGPHHPEVATSLNNLALAYQSQGRFAEAEPVYRRSLAIRETALGPDHPLVAQSLNNFASLPFAQGSWAKAAERFGKAAAVVIRRARRGIHTAEDGPVSRGPNEAAQSKFEFSMLVKSVFRSRQRRGSGQDRTIDEMFRIAQWAEHSQAASSLAQMSARQAKNDGPLAGLVRERQDLVAEWRRRDTNHTQSASLPPDKRNKNAEQSNLKRLATLTQRIGELDERLKVRFPEYASLTNPQPLSIGSVQKYLRDNEALVVFLETPKRGKTPDETFVWAVTKSSSRWVRSEGGSAWLREQVDALRCGLDFEGAWRGSRCFDLLNTVFSEDDYYEGRPLPFSLKRAHRVYKALFGKIEELIAGKELLVVPSGPLTQLPFHVLVAEPPAKDGLTRQAFLNAEWLIKRHAVTVLPSVTSLQALRAVSRSARRSAATPFVAFGNPLLSGPDGSDRSAWKKQSCDSLQPGKTHRASKRSLGAEPATLFANGLANVAQLKRQAPLAETADEICAVASSLGVTKYDNAVFLGSNAMERNVKRLSAEGVLRRAAILHFATHGLVAGETAQFARNRAEPALLMTPPRAANQTDDGLLTSSEIAQLKLDADWVVLSACNTAAGYAKGAQALSGLARAFFYAGARSLLVSHWYVNSQATVQLITSAFGEMKREKGLSRSAALRRAMLAVQGNTTGDSWHPSNWAPFVVVGEPGGRD